MKRINIFLCFCFVLLTQAAAQISVVKYAVIPETPRPGEPVTIGAAAGSLKTAALLVRGRQLSTAGFFLVPAAGNTPGFMAAVLTVPSTIAPGPAVIRLEGSAGPIEIPLNIEGREFVSEVIELDPVLTGIRTDPDPRKTAESNRLSSILGRVGNEIHCTDTFNPPVWSTRRTSFFGDRRVFKYSNGTNDTSIHAGVDFGVPTGTRVIVCGSGKVVLARMRIVTGNSIVVEHAPGIYSLYYHLDKIEVKEGDIVSAGVLLGLSGATGLATGPHLHWELRVNTENTDPDAFVGRYIIDKDAILSKIRN
jgi:murein DD-endopeptidase MepM/ murein hydrolase activator NlpD